MNTIVRWAARPWHFVHWLTRSRHNQILVRPSQDDGLDRSAATVSAKSYEANSGAMVYLWRTLNHGLFYCLVWRAFRNTGPAKVLALLPKSDALFHLGLFTI